MKLSEIYNLAVQMGTTYDIRGNYLEKILEQNQKAYQALTADEKDYFDQECLFNPYNDTRILVGSGEEEIKSILCGIDMETPEILLADRLCQRGIKVDLVLAHHPEGIADAQLHEVMQMQADMLEKMGVPINIGEGLMAARINEVRRGRMPFNHQRAVDAARLLNFPFMCVHTAADNLAAHFMQRLMDKSNISTLDDILNLLFTIPEYAEARKLKAGPAIILGDMKRRAGKVFVKFSGGTATADKAYEKLAQAGVGTMICMHLTEKHRQAARENNINVIVAGHMASDSLGMNLFLDELEKRGTDVIPCSGLIRVKRFSGSEVH
ncbi:GTP cyclohydrolase 1 type 2/Nif3 [Syntrophomonas zehnderi OL-4]|uniref:GTP cyclohydrolase 1 type 2/Nif3 n=1 Tax=Syntrophomonas zehnderi OL-4 TaxID=690567 RepID=A0A0E4GDP7_9FIRM|nr:NGG1p interacting factor 3 protein, NIF3 [Syntrophomonas zehnderi]CFX55150.1 GTP cyclohydrolase 1 type 2/Nif3 [Syntrophomonas zehnderi OL-4]